ncbi:hypothetical protein ACQ4PT_051715 [Festuca glaucescens]
MGKYMRRKCSRGGAGGDGEAAPAAVVLGGGVRTRSRSATAVVVVAGAAPANRRKQAAEATTATGPVEAAGCYLHLRSRRLFMPAVAARGGPGQEEASTSRPANSVGSGDAIAAGISRCSSTASSTVDAAAARHRSGGEAEACEGRDVESSVSDSGCDARERRETTPSSHPPVDYISDLESSQATDEQRHSKRRRRTPATTTASTSAFHLQPIARMPAAAEIEQFFAAAEKAEAERFAAKYNFDVALGVPLDAGRFEWTPVAAV